MVKHFNIIMAGVISGVVALFTSILGISGTIIGAVLTSFLYQLLSTYYEEKTKDMDLSQIRSNNKAKEKSLSSNPTKRHRIIFIFPVIVILLIECLFVLTFAHYGFLKIFNLLESLTDQNLFRVMGLGLILISFYPFFRPKIVDKSNGIYLFIIGALLLIRGLVDSVNILNKLFYLGLNRLDLLFGIIVIVVLLIVVVRVLKSIFDDSSNDNEFVSYDSVRKVDTHFNKFNNQNHTNLYQNDYYQNDNYLSNNQYPNNQSYNYSNNNYDDTVPIYEEDFIYVKDPNNPNRAIKKRILKKVDTGYKPRK